MFSSRYVTVVPLRRMPVHVSEFTYRVPDEFSDHVKTGSVVSIPFKRSIITGVVIHHADGGTVKSARDILGIHPITLRTEQLHISRYAATFYVQSLSSIFRSFIPELTKQKVVNEGTFHRNASKSTSHSHTSDPLKGYFLYASFDQFLKFLGSEFKKCDTSGQILIIAPEIHQQEMVAARLRSYGITDVMVINKRTQKHAYAESWNRAKNTRVIIGSMTGLFFPFNSVRHVLIIEAENPVFKKAEQNPRYHLSELVWVFADQYNASVMISGFSPDIRLLYECKKRKLSIRQVGVFAPVNILDRNESDHEKSAVSVAVIDALKASHHSLVIYNRLGDVRVIRCGDCGLRVVCEQCNRPVYLDEQSDLLVCSICFSSRKNHTRCVRCLSTKSKKSGVGIGVIAHKIRSEFPGRSVIEVTGMSTLDKEKIRTGDIIVATNKIFSLDQQNFDCAVMIDSDADLYLPYISAAETLRFYIQKLRSMSEITILQTNTPHNKLYTSMDKVSDFYHEEIKWRKEFSYPPFGETARIFYRHPDQKKVELLMRTLLDQIRGIEYFGPYIARSRSSYLGFIIVKYKNRTHAIHSMLTTAAKNYLIEINPYQSQ